MFAGRQRGRVASVSGLALLLGACAEPSAIVDADAGTSGDADGTSGDGDGDASGDGDGDGDGTGDGDASGDGDGDASGDGDGDASGDGDGDAEPDARLVALETYAPRVYFPADEVYWPSAVELAFLELDRFADGEGRYWVRTQVELDAPSDTLPFFAGDLASAPVYGFWADKGGGVVDLVYFFFYPYNRGKEVADTIWGNHVGDWEHITVRLQAQPDRSYAPSQVYLSAHNFGGAYDWASGEVELVDGTHPVVYSAWGSHGLWAAPGDHVYMTIGETDPLFDVCVTLICADLVDETSAGVAWDTWTSLVGYDYAAQEGLGDASWPVWMSDAFTEAGAGDPSVPGGGPIYRWGNPEDCSVLGIPFDITDLIGVCRLEDGPTGPVSKGVWGPELG